MSSENEPLGSDVWWRRRSAPTSRRVLDADRIVREALSLADTSGLSAVTMRALAKRLDTGAASLYRHIESRDALLLLLVDHVLGSARARLDAMGPVPGSSWRDALRRVAIVTREVLTEHASVVGALPVGPHVGPHALRLQEVGLAALREAGFEPKKALLAFVTLAQWVFGFVIQECSTSDRKPPTEVIGARLASATPETLPEFTALGSIPHHLTADEEFVFGLEVLLRGLEVYVDGG